MLLLTGAPRCGLSLLALYLIQLDFMTSPKARVNNSFQCPDVHAINSDILRIAGCAWNNVPNAATFATNGAIQYRIASYLARNPNVQFLVDPLFAFTWQLWEKAAQDVDLFISFREPGENALSIRRVYGGYVTEAASIWQQYNLRLATVCGAAVEFGASIDFEDFNDNVDRAMRFLDLDHRTAKLEKVYDVNKIQTTTSTAVMPLLKNTYQLLQSRKEN